MRNEEAHKPELRAQVDSTILYIFFMGKEGVRGTMKIIMLAIKNPFPTNIFVPLLFLALIYAFLVDFYKNNQYSLHLVVVVHHKKIANIIFFQNQSIEDSRESERFCCSLGDVT